MWFWDAFLITVGVEFITQFNNAAGDLLDFSLHLCEFKFTKTVYKAQIWLFFRIQGCLIKGS